MLVETIELTLAHVDLGVLDEAAAMILFANAHAHRITRGTGGSLHDITDAAGTVLYGGYYFTHLTVPPARLLSRFRVWDRVEVGVDVERFGPLLLSSTYVLGAPGEVGDGAWDAGTLPAMRAGATFYEDNAGGRAAAPRPGTLADMDRRTRAPDALERFRAVRAAGRVAPRLAAGWTHDEPLAYALVPGRDLRPGHGVLFARWVTIADVFERSLLESSGWSPALVDALHILERESYYLATRRSSETLAGRVTARLARDDGAQVGILESRVEISAADGALLWACRARKLLAPPGHLAAEAEALHAS